MNGHEHVRVRVRRSLGSVLWGVVLYLASWLVMFIVEISAMVGHEYEGMVLFFVIWTVWYFWFWTRRLKRYRN